jgi:hypothetical protein
MKTAKTKKEHIDTPREVKTGARPAKVELVSYSIKMTIPTAQYANIIPEIVVKAGTVEEAHDYIAPHMNKLWKEYYMISERRPEPVAPQQAPAPATSVAFTKASQAIASCLSIEALEIIDKQIGVSVKLTDEDKSNLIPMIADKKDELNGKVNPA